MTDPEHSPEHRWAEQSLNALVRWMPIGGGGGAFLHFVLMEQNWAMALAMFPVTVVTGIWAAYTENFVTRFRELASTRGRKDPDKLVSLAAMLNAALRWQLSGFKSKYLRCQANSCRYYVTEGFATEHKPLLQELYIPLDISGEGVNSSALEDIQRSEPTQFELHYSTSSVQYWPFWHRLWQQLRLRSALAKANQHNQIWHVLRQAKTTEAYRQTMIIAKGGYGKTTLLKNLAYQYATCPGMLQRRYRIPKLIPFLLYLRHSWRDEAVQPGRLTLPDLIVDYHIPSLIEGQTLTLPPNWVQGLLRRGEALIMLDGFDEVPEHQREAMTRWIGRQMQQYPRTLFIITSRPEGYEAFKQCPDAQRLSTIFVKEFNREQRRQFIHQWYQYREQRACLANTTDVRDTARRKAIELLKQIEQRHELREMAGNPLLLNMIAEVHRSNPDIELPGRRTELYDEICDVLLVRRPREKGQNMPLQKGQRRQVLQQIALSMSQKEVVRLNPATLKTLVIAALEHELDGSEAAETLSQTADALIKAIVTVSEVLIDREKSHEYEFTHRTFQDYLAACQLRTMKQAGEAMLAGVMGEAWWRETTLLYAELVNPTRLIEAACNGGQPEAIETAYRCWQMGKNISKVSTEIYQQLQHRRYEYLANLLRAGQWKAADYETYRLMIRTVGQEDSQFFSIADLKNFPCEDLQRLDQLWRYYSQGKFGFSVQKEIFIRCGGLTHGRYNKAAWQQLAHHTGWMVEERDLPYSSFLFSLELAPTGHLPCRVFDDREYNFGLLASFLAVRFAACVDSSSAAQSPLSISTATADTHCLKQSLGQPSGDSQIHDLGLKG